MWIVAGTTLARSGRATWRSPRRCPECKTGPMFHPAHRWGLCWVRLPGGEPCQCRARKSRRPLLRPSPCSGQHGQRSGRVKDRRSRPRSGAAGVLIVLAGWPGSYERRQAGPLTRGGRMPALAFGHAGRPTQPAPRPGDAPRTGGAAWPCRGASAAGGRGLGRPGRRGTRWPAGAARPWTAAPAPAPAACGRAPGRSGRRRHQAIARRCHYRRRSPGPARYCETVVLGWRCLRRWNYPEVVLGTYV
jgi:hypothetical protein